MRFSRRVFGAVMVGVLALAACGGDDDPEGSGSGGGETAGGELALDEPVRLVLLAEVAGESELAIDAYRNGVELAVNEINAAGGIGGQEIELTRIPASPIDPQDTSAAFLEALDAEPTAVMGLPGSGTQLNAVVGTVERSGVPVLVVGQPEDSSRFGADGGSTYAWFLGPYTNGLAGVGMQFFAEELGVESVGLMGTNENHGSASIDGARDAIEDLDLEVVDERTYDPTATDLTEAVVAMRGADAVGNWGYPNPIGVQLTQFVQNGLDVPTIVSGGSGSIVVGGGLAEGEAIDNLYDAVPCNPAAGEDPELQAFAEAYEGEWGEPPTYQAATAYDGVHVVKAAIEQAGSADPETVNEALGSVSATEGVVCVPEYKADGSHIMNHSARIIDYAADGSSSEVASYEIEELDEAG